MHKKKRGAAPVEDAYPSRTTTTTLDVVLATPLQIKEAQAAGRATFTRTLYGGNRFTFVNCSPSPVTGPVTTSPTPSRIARVAPALTNPGTVTPAASQPAHAGITLRAAIDEVIAAKINAGLRPQSIKQLNSTLRQFSKGRESVPLAAIGVRDLETWLDGRKVKPMTRQGNVGRLSALFSYHVRRDNIITNPCRRLERIKVEHTAPLILTPDQADTLLKHTPCKFRAYVILGMFAGIRPEETEKLTWEDICFDTKTVTVNLAKTRRRRIVPLEPRAVALLEKCTFKKGNIVSSRTAVRRFKREVREALGFDSWPHDLLRHTAASYLLALIGDSGKVASRLGNSSSILLTHYHQPVKQADCEKFWTVKPCPPAPRWPPLPERKYNYKAIRAFYDACQSYKKTREHFGITNSATLHYILKKSRAAKPITS